MWAFGSSPWDAPTLEKVERELWRLAQEILRLGLSVVLDFGFGRGSNVTTCDPPLAAFVSVSSCTISMYLPRNAGGA